MNRQMLIGHLGKDPEVRYTTNGRAVASFSIAVSEKYGEKTETEWFSIIAWEKLAETCGNYLKKGSKVYVSGKTRTRKYTPEGGTEREIKEVVINEMEMLDKRSDTN